MAIKTVAISEAPANTALPTVEFIKNDFERLIWNRGYDVIHEQALRCPCKGANTNQQSNCKNCGGSGWTFINAVETRMVIHSMNLDTKYKEWSEVSVGTASITCLDRENLSFMDRITVKDSRTIFTEALFLKQIPGNLFFYTVYDIIEIQYIAVFDTVNTKYENIFYNTDFTYTRNKIILNSAKWSSLIPTDGDLSITIRYVHNGQYHIIDLPRDTMESFTKITGFEKKEPNQLPIHAVGRRSHYVLDAENFAGNRVLDNSVTLTHDQLNPPKSNCC